MSKVFIPSHFNVPNVLKTSAFYICPLDRNVAKLDYEAVMSSLIALQGIFGPNSNWPSPNMTLEDSIASLEVHEQEFVTRKAFAYSILNANQNKCLGSIYIDPSRSEKFDCEIHFWVRSDSIELESKINEIISDWIQTQWPFTNVIYPGRNISWENWQTQLTTTTSFVKQ